MNITELLTPKLTLCQHSTSSKKRVLEEVAQHICTQHPYLDSNEVFSALIDRERLGSTGIGNGIAIPHCRIANCTKTIAMLITLESGIDFDAIDNETVDIIFILLVPENAHSDHLQTLSSIAEKLSSDTTQQNIRKASSNETLYEVITA